MPATAKKGAGRATKHRAATKPLVVAMLDVASIDPSPENRQADVDLDPLVESVRSYGIQMPIKVRPKGDRFEIVFGSAAGAPRKSWASTEAYERLLACATRRGRRSTRSNPSPRSQGARRRTCTIG